MFTTVLRLAVSAVVLVGGSAMAAEVSLDREGQVLTGEVKIKAGKYRLPDAGNDGAILIQGDGTVVDFQGAELVGCADRQQPDRYTGQGLVIRGKNITLKNAKVRGYKGGIVAVGCPGLLIEDVDISGNYQKHLLSTPQAEDGSDWMFPHNNDKDEWLNNYGAGLWVKNSDGVTIRRVRARHSQNGILLSNVNNSKIYDNDCSFLSGWGLALWRSNKNVITRNAFDFCIRGYSHGVYNRGQDSAGILMFEQNSGNLIAENSVTHGGDGFFGFAGREALGEAEPPAGFDHTRKGNNDNLLINNDFSYAAAHGIEMTFSFGNQFIGNRMVENAICGVWGGLCQDTLIMGNTFEGNGEMGYGLERGGINIDSGRNNRIIGNTFKGNKAGVHLWGPAGKDFRERGWGKANRPASEDNVIAGNTFNGDQLALHLRGENRNILFVDNKLAGVGKEIDASANSEVKTSGDYRKPEVPRYEALGETRPVGARKHLAGRKNIIMTEWGPYDFADVLLFPTQARGGREVTFQVLGPSGRYSLSRVGGDVKIGPISGPLPATIQVTAPRKGFHTFEVELEADGKKLSATGTLFWADWDVRFFQWEKDPREDAAAWKELIGGTPIDRRSLESIDFKWGGGRLGKDLPADKFGTVATTSVQLPKGRYRISTVSDDGIRVWVGDTLIIDDWTWHPPKENNTAVELTAGVHPIRIEHFEIDGFAQLQFQLERAE